MVYSRELQKQGDEMNVYDIKNAGPNHRFTVRGSTGQPLVVSNCIQSLARDIIGDMVLELDKLFGVALQVHDEIVCIVPESEAESAKAKMLEVMSTPQGWYADLPLAAEAGYGASYGEAK